MSLTFNKIAFEEDGTPSHGVPVAERYDSRNPDDYIVIYYHPTVVSIPVELQGDRAYELLGALTEDASQDLRIPASVDKLLKVENSVLSGDVPSNPEMRKIYSQVKAEYDRRTCRMMHTDHDDDTGYRFWKCRPVSRCIKDQVDRHAVFGSSGCGKSTYASEHALQYQRRFPLNRIFLFSRKASDPVFDGVIRNLIRVKLDKDFVRQRQLDNMDPEKALDRFENSLLIFDDFTVIPDKSIAEAILHLKDAAYELGRDKGIDIVSIHHKALGGTKTRQEYTECTHMTVFPTMNPGESKNAIMKFLACEKKDANYIMSQVDHGTRWLCILRPNIMISDKFVRLF
jgi:hypothetical protein